MRSVSGIQSERLKLRESKRTGPTKKGREKLLRKLKPVPENFWTVALPESDGKSQKEILMGRRNRPKLHQSPEYDPEKWISRQEEIQNQHKDFKQVRRRSSTRMGGIRIKYNYK